MQDLVALAQAAGQVEKLGIVGLLVVVIGFQLWVITWLKKQYDAKVKELTRVYGLRDKWRIGYTMCKQALDANNIKIDLSAMQEVEKEDVPA